MSYNEMVDKLLGYAREQIALANAASAAGDPIASNEYADAADAACRALEVPSLLRMLSGDVDAA